LLQGILARNVCADDIRLNGEITYQSIDSKITNKITGDEFDSNTYLLLQNYNFNLLKTIYPFLTFEAGTLFDLDETTTKSEGQKTKIEERTLKPFVELRLNNPIYQASLQYTRTEIHEETTNAPNTDDFRDEYDAVLGWQPADLPEVVFRYNYTHTYDDPETVDLKEKLLTVEANYTAWRELSLNYFYTRTDTDNRLTGFDTLEQAHFGRADYSHNFYEGRFFLATSYRINYSTFEFSGAPSAQAPLLRFQGLFSLDDTPQDGPALTVNNGLIDGNLVASTGIDIGLGGNELTLTNIGVDLGSTIPVNEIQIWVDRPLTNPVADYFSWSVYTSPDNEDNSTWTLVATVSPAPFGTFDNVFTISFPEVSTRYIKVVTRPLLDTVPGAPSFNQIFVTEMEAFGTVTGASAQQTQKDIDWTYDLNVRAKITDRTTLGYNFFYNYRDQDPISNKRTELSNTLSLNHIFNQIFTTSARLSRTDTKEELGEDIVEYNYSLLLKGNYLPTFGQTLTFSGNSQKGENDSSDDFSIILRNNARLYRGWSLLFDLGYNWDRPPASDETEQSILVRAGTNFVPNQMLNINLDLVQRETIKPDKDSRYDLSAEAFFVPTRSLSFNARFSVVERTGFETRTLQNYVVTWSPFPEGALQFFFNYNETLQSVENQRETSIGPGFNWTISNHFFLEMSYNYQKTKSDTQKVESNNLFAEFRFVF
jgi:hypothetical protein